MTTLINKHQFYLATEVHQQLNGHEYYLDDPRLDIEVNLESDSSDDNIPVNMVLNYESSEGEYNTFKFPNIRVEFEKTDSFDNHNLKHILNEMANGINRMGMEDLTVSFGRTGIFFTMSQKKKVA